MRSTTLGRLTPFRRGAQRPATRPKGGRWVVVVLVLLCGSYLFAIGGSFLIWSRAGGFDEFIGPFMLVYSLVGTIFAARTACRADVPRRTRVGWRWIAASFAILLASCVVFSQMPQPGFPTAGDGLRLLLAPVLLTGLLRLMPPPSTPHERHKLALDNAVVTAAGAMLLWYLLVGPALAVRGEVATVTAAAAAYPILDLAMIFGATQVVIRPGPHSRRRPSLLIAVAVMLLVIGDVFLVYQHLNTAHQTYGGFQFGCWLTAYFLFALAAVDQSRSAPVSAAAAIHPTAPTATWLPYLAVGAGYLLLLVVVVTQLPFYPYVGLVVGAVVLTCLVEARQILASRENHVLATTDNLTGLANRASLHDHIARALHVADRRSERVAVLLIDLDGFKSFNDALGHEAGDQILVRFAQLLQNSVRPTDLVARIGGDEFVVVLTSNDPLGAAPLVARRIVEATHQPMTVRGQVIHMRASIGIAQSDLMTCNAAELLDRADTAMYQDKRAGHDRPGPGGEPGVPVGLGGRKHRADAAGSAH